MTLALERLITSPLGFAQTKASPLQRAMWRIADGVAFDDLLALHTELEPQLVQACGPGGYERLRALGPMRPIEFLVICGIRTAKSVTCAAIALKAALTADLSHLLPWEQAAVSILSLNKKKAKIVLRHLVGPLMAQPKLKALLAREPTSETVWIRRPSDGRIVRIEIVAGANAGGSLVGDWSCGAIFDEFPRMSGEDDGKVVNFDESRKAVLARLVPGAQLVAVGSPHAPSGPGYDAVQNYWGNPTEEIIVLRPFAGAMNPNYWTAKRVEQLRKSPKGEHVYRTDYLGEFADLESSFFTGTELDAARRKEPYDAPREDDVQYFGAIDPAKRRNAFTLVIGGRRYNKDGSFRIVVACVRQWIPEPGRPLEFVTVLASIKAECERYGVIEVFTDQWRSEELASLGANIGLSVTDYELGPGESSRLYNELRVRVLTGGMELHPEPALRADLLAVRKLVRRQSVIMDLPVTNDGRHCDYAPALALLNEIASQSPGWMHAMQKLGEGGGRLT